MVEESKIQTIVFGGGCFWCTEAVFLQLKGVISVTSGYAGGTTSHPTYEEVSSGATGHAEVIRIEYDPSVVPLEKLLEVFFMSHDPTTRNRQGADVGTQYRSIILYTSEAQRTEAEAFIGELNRSHPDGAPIATEVRPLERFWEAEEGHCDYYAKNSRQAYCQIVINPKLEKVQKEFSELLKNRDPN